MNSLQELQDCFEKRMANFEADLLKIDRREMYLHIFIYTQIHTYIYIYTYTYTTYHNYLNYSHMKMKNLNIIPSFVTESVMTYKIVELLS